MNKRWLLSVVLTTGSLILFSALLMQSVWSCPSGEDSDSPQKDLRLRKAVKDFQPHGFGSRRSLSSLGPAAAPSLPFADASGTVTPWGGEDAAKWKPEAILANGASTALNEAWAEKAAIQDVVVAVPVQMLRSQYHPYGDGQTNSSLTWGGGWSQTRPPFVATLTRYSNGKMRIHFHFDRSLDLGNLLGE